MAEVPIVALHGLGGDHRQFDGMLAGNAARYCPDLRGHGRSDLASDAGSLTIRQLAADVRAGRGCEEPPVLVGISMGAAIALDLVSGGFDARGLVLVRPAWHWTPNPPNLDVFGAIADALDQGRTASHFAQGSAYAAVSTVSPAAADALLGHFDGASRRSTVLRALPASAPGRPAHVPRTLVLGCDVDPTHPLALALAVAHDIGADFAEIPPRYDRPEEYRVAVSAAITRFVSEV